MRKAVLSDLAWIVPLACDLAAKHYPMRTPDRDRVRRLATECVSSPLGFAATDGEGSLLLAAGMASPWAR